MISDDNLLVYSTDPDVNCRCTHGSKPEGKFSHAQKISCDGIVRVSRETKGRKGKGVTVITGLGLKDAALVELAQKLKRRFGAGGTVTGSNIELQGEHRDALVTELQKFGFTVKKAGG
jgi:translation initiation factor 1